MTTEPTTDNQPEPEFPTAELRPRGKLARQVIGGSRMWWATLAAMVVAGGLVYRSIEHTGPEISIRFPEGHGLKVGDFVRHRGIDVGHVDRIDLAGDLNSIDVTVTLLHGADGLAREGTRFWIVRPEIRLTEIRGLETAVGAKYIAVSPGNVDGPECLEFVGLAAQPPGNLNDRGLEVVLRGEESYGLYPDAPVAWRGVDVGQVLAVDLASDTRYVDVRIRVFAPYRNLVRTNSMFWATSGLGIDAGLTGFSLKAESLTTIARGGVSFITPADDSADHVRPGHVFTLHPKEDNDWTDDASTVSLVDFSLPPTVALRAHWKEKSFGFTRNREADFGAAIVQHGDQAAIVAPANAFARADAAIDDSWWTEVIARDTGEPIYRLPATPAAKPLAGGIARHSFAVKPPLAKYAIDQAALRTATEPEDCCLVRSVASSEGPGSVIHSLSRTQLAPGDGRWRVDTLGVDLDDWHGAVAAGTADGSVVGMFVVGPAGPTIVLLGETLVE